MNYGSNESFTFWQQFEQTERETDHPIVHFLESPQRNKWDQWGERERERETGKRSFHMSKMIWRKFKLYGIKVRDSGFGVNSQIVEYNLLVIIAIYIKCYDNSKIQILLIVIELLLKKNNNLIADLFQMVFNLKIS